MMIFLVGYRRRARRRYRHGMRRLLYGAVAALVAVAVAGCGPSSKASRPGGGTAAGQPAHKFSAPPPAPLRDGERFIHLSMARPYTPSPPAGATDEYRCFLLDPQLTKATFITGSQFQPQNADLVHHAIFFRVEPGEVAQARQLDADSAGDGWTCFGGTGVGSGNRAVRQLGSGAAWIAAWAPGGKESVIDPHLGYEMQPGGQIIMQIHYNLLATGGKAQGADQSGILLRVKDGTANLAALQTTLLPAPVELPCASGESGPLCARDAAVLDVWHRFGQEAGATVSGLNLLCNAGQQPVPGPTQQCDQKVRQAGTIYAVAGHMHLLGRSIKVELNPGTPQAKVLLDVPVYNFDDQGARPLATPVTVKPGDVYRVTCTHDAALRGLLPQLKPLKPRYVVWGEGTSDEMCLGIVTWSKPSGG
jgi:Copper type II ascorbate-dependent monooxygenase, N-terminal domain/Copper type II ascorbate-dependent monooxygenase, C-terminal domain